jgi:AbrB family looped-hinge helix DNA binding protein
LYSFGIPSAKIVLGKKGRITIPFEIRQRIGFRYNDVLSFTELDDSSVVVRREKICDNCKKSEEDFEENFTLEDFLDSLSEEEQKDALLHLSLLWAEKKRIS